MQGGKHLGHLHEFTKKEAFNYLAKLGFDVNFLEAVLDEGYLISGSAILKMLTNGTWLSRDIDFFLMLPESYSDEELMERIRHTFKPSGNFISPDIPMRERYPELFRDRFDKVLRTEIRSFHLMLDGIDQEINVIMGLETIKTTEEFILNEFDFDLCSNWISKEGVFTKVKNISSASKAITIHRHTMKELLKCKESFRDYYGVDKNTPLYVDDVINILTQTNCDSRVYKRFLKYKARGFIFPQVIKDTQPIEELI